MEPAKLRAIRRYLAFNDIKYRDVQAELVDHFASAVEKIEKDKPAISFKEALLEAHRKFGGRRQLRHYMDQAEKKVERKTWRLLGRAIISQFDWPQFLLTLGITAFWFVLTPRLPFEFGWLTLGFLLAFIAVVIRNYFHLKRVPLYLPRQANRSLGSLFMIGGWYPTIGHIFNQIAPTWPWLACFYTLMSLALLAFIKIPQLAIAETEHLYPNIG